MDTTISEIKLSKVLESSRTIDANDNIVNKLINSDDDSDDEYDKFGNFVCSCKCDSKYDHGFKLFKLSRLAECRRRRIRQHNRKNK